MLNYLKMDNQEGRKMIIASWNIRTMRLPGKIQEIADEVLSNNIDITALQEVRWDGSGRVDKKRYAMFYSGTQTKTGQCGTRFIVAKRMKNNILQFEPINK
jgi:exonuclease III